MNIRIHVVCSSVVMNEYEKHLYAELITSAV
jgi:hypothetical protein